MLLYAICIKESKRKKRAILSEDVGKRSTFQEPVLFIFLITVTSITKQRGKF